MLDRKVELTPEGIPIRWSELDKGRYIVYIPRITNSSKEIITGTPRLAEIRGLFPSTQSELGNATNRILVEAASREDHRFSEEYEVFLFRSHEKPNMGRLDKPGEWCFVNYVL